MSKYNVGDILEITERFSSQFAQYVEGERYKVAKATHSTYELAALGSSAVWSASPDMFDAIPHVRKVAPIKRGDKVTLAWGAHSSPGLSTDAYWKVLNRLEDKGLSMDTVFEAVSERDSDGDVELVDRASETTFYILEKFLVPYVEEAPQHIQLGKTYKHRSNGMFYRPTEFKFDTEEVLFDFGSLSDSLYARSMRPFLDLSNNFGVLPPIKPEPVEETVPADRPTVQLEALREAAEFLNAIITPDLLALAKRLEK